MTATLFFDPQARPLSTSGAILPASYLQFYLTQTTTPEDVYADADLSTPLSNPVVADSEGRFDFIYMDPAVTYRVQLYDADDVLIWDVDPYVPPRDFQPGTVMFFYGTSTQRDTAYPPASWAVLDGNNGTPNGLERFVRIAGGTVAVGATGGASTDTANTTDESSHTHAGGTTGSTTLTEAQIPAHTHGVTYGLSDNAGGVPPGSAQTFGTVNTLTTSSTGGGTGHTHTGGTTAAGSAHNHSVTIDTIPPYVALWAIMRRYP